MPIEQQIKDFISSQPEPKRSDMLQLHQLIQQLDPNGKLWFLDGKNEDGKIVSNPNIGYGSHIMQYAGGKTRAFYQVGLSANTTGISIYIMGIEDKKYLADTFSKTLGKASISGYCIKFKSLSQIDIEVLKQAICYGFQASA